MTPKAASPTVNPPAPLPPALLATTTGPSMQKDLVTRSGHIARVDTRITNVEKSSDASFRRSHDLHCSGSNGTTSFFIALPLSMKNWLLSMPAKHRVTLCTSSHAPLPPLKRLRAPAGSATGRFATVNPAAATAAAKPPGSPAQPLSPVPSEPIPALESVFHGK